MPIVLLTDENWGLKYIGNIQLSVEPEKDFQSQDQGFPMHDTGLKIIAKSG